MNKTVKDILIKGGVFVPAQLIYGARISTGAFHTWIWLRGLAGENGLTPAFSLEEIGQMCGKSVSTLYGHLAILRSNGAISWQTTQDGLVIIDFGSEGGKNADGNDTGGENAGGEKAVEDSNLQESKNALSLDINDSDSINELRGERGEAAFQNFRSPEIKTQEPGRALCGENAVDIYRSLTHQRLYPTQREALEKLEDPDLWRATVAHWLMHGWNPGNVSGILDLYHRGGPTTCRFCGDRKAKSASSAADTIAALDRLMAELEGEAGTEGQDGQG